MPEHEPTRLRDIDWRWRVRIALGVMAFCAAIVVYALVAEKTGQVAATAVNGCLTLLGAVTGVFFVGSSVEAWRALK
jgi:hypothetical protein